jgi:Stress responsive A/B Barrel Domain
VKLEINRRDLVCGMAGSFALLPQFGWSAAATDATIMHVIRIKLGDNVDPALRRQLMASVHRFKQIRGPRAFVVGRDLAPAGAPSYDVAQLSLLQGAPGYRSYFYDPIHLAADREAQDAKPNPFAGVSSFDTVSGGDAALGEQLQKIGTDRDAQFRANDTRPTSPPVPDRAADMKWEHGARIYHVLRFNLAAMSPAQRTERFAAIQRCAQIKGVEQLVSGANVSRSPADRYTHAMLVVLENPDAYGRFLKDPLFQAEKAAGGVLASGNVEWFDIIDPAVDGLGERLRGMHT